MTTEASSGRSAAASIGPEVVAVLRPHVGVAVDDVLAAVGCHSRANKGSARD